VILFRDTFPVNAPDHLIPTWKGKITRPHWDDLAASRSTKSLRQLAEQWGVSHETIRRTLKRSGTGSALDPTTVCV
jgi:hypothetical protein